MNIQSIRLALELDESTGIYTVTSPDVPGLVTEGQTPDEIRHNVQEALDGLMKAWADLGQEPPPVLRRRSIPKNTEILVTLP